MVDDEPLNMEVLQVHLEMEGYERFISVADSTTALAVLRRERPDVLLLDLLMPHVSGFDILAEMRRDSELKHLPVLVLTSSDDAETKLRALQLGATDFLAKPVDASELALRMRNTLTARAYQQRIMYFDALTDLPNRLFFSSAVRQAIVAVADTDQQAALILININRFKAINDSLGPDQGDDVLWAFCQRLQAVFDVDADAGCLAGPADKLNQCVARLGGDRFAVLLRSGPAGAERDSLEEYADEFLAALEMPFIVDEQDVYLDVSMGISMLTRHSADVEPLINNAETAMLHARRRQDTSCSFYSEQMDAQARELLKIESGLRTAVENNELFLVFQPKVDVQSNVIVGAEALLRWLHPDLGFVSPVDFIPIAESTGMIVPIGAWVLREACRRTVEWHKGGYSGFEIAVNVSIRQMHEPGFIVMVKNVLEETGLPAEALIIEMTENMIMENAEANIVQLQKLKEIGLKISIDDFGTGYSSLSYLQRFPLDQLKIDQSFIREIKTAEDQMPIIKAVTSLAHDLGLSVVAEGIEKQHQLAHVKALKCEEYQGYLCSKPLSVTDFTTFLKLQQQRCA